MYCECACLIVLENFPLPRIKHCPRNALLGLVAILPLSEPTLWCLLGRIAKCVKVAFRYPLRVLPGEASHSGVLSQVGYPGFQGQT
jgi:hypothetical protein